MNRTLPPGIRKFALASTLAIAVALSGPGAFAATATSAMTVAASVVNNCAIATTAATLAGYDPVGANSATGVDLTGTGAVLATCTAGAATQIILGQGLTPAAGSTDAAPLRQMASAATPANVLAYGLYQTAGVTTPWTNSLAGGFYPYTGTGNQDTLTVYVDIPKGQNVPAAADYADTVVATINF